MFNGGEFSKILDEIFEKDDKEKEKAIKIYCKIWEYLENITLQNLKYKRVFEILKDSEIIKIGNNPFNNTYYLQRNDTNGNIVVIKLTKEEHKLIEELINNGNI